MTLTKNTPFATVASYSGAIIALTLALVGAYLALDRRVNALAATAITSIQIEHIVDLKTEDRLEYIIQHQDAIDDKLTRIESILLDRRL